MTTTTNSFLLIPDPAHPLAALVDVPGGKGQSDGGGIYYVDVLEKKASLLERMFPSIREGSTLVNTATAARPLGVGSRSPAATVAPVASSVSVPVQRDQYSAAAAW